MSTTSTYLRCLDVRENEATKVHVSNIYMYRNRKVIEIECGGDCVRVCGIPGRTPERGYRRDPYRDYLLQAPRRLLFQVTSGKQPTFSYRT